MIDLQVDKANNTATLRNSEVTVVSFDIPTVDGYYSLGSDLILTSVTQAVATTLDTLIIYIQSGDITIVKSPVEISIYEVAQDFTFTEVLAGTATASQSIHGASGTTTPVGWDATTNIATEIETFTNGNTSIEFINSGEYDVHASVFTEQGANNRSTYSLALLHKDSSDVTKRTYYLDSMYIRDDANTYDSGLMGFNKRLNVVAGDKIEVVIEVLDVQTTSATVNLDTTKSQIFIDRVQYW